VIDEVQNEHPIISALEKKSATAGETTPSTNSTAAAQASPAPSNATAVQDAPLAGVAKSSISAPALPEVVPEPKEA